jgi:hypothetical protein
MSKFENIVFTSEYLVCIEGKYDLEQINLQISGEEASFSKFLRSKISRSGSNRLNFVVFRELPPDTIPKEIMLLKTTVDQPRDTVHIWTGVILVNNTTEAVSAYRAI